MFSHAFTELKRRRGKSYRQIAAATEAADPAGRGLSAGHLARLASGDERPGVRGIELVAAALEMEPDYFSEYRLALARWQLDERSGLDAALNLYEEIEPYLDRQAAPSLARRRQVA